MHSEFLKRLRDIANVRLIAKLNDDRIGFPFPDQIRVILPDMHLFSKERQEEYHYKCFTNYNSGENDLFPMLAKLLFDFKKSKPDNVYIYQIGDFFDLWRETDKPYSLDEAEAQGFIQKIIESNSDVCRYLLDKEMGVNFLLGNHDYEMHRIPGYYERWRYLRYFINNEKGIPSSLLLHGDLFRWYERIPTWLKQYVVHNFSPKTRNKNLDLSIRKTHTKNGEYIDYKNEKDAEDLYLLGQCTEPETDEPEWNLMRKDEALDSQTLFLDKSRKLVEEVNRQTGYRIGLTIIGHTHCARIAIDDTGDSPFILMDCGAWINESKTVVIENNNTKEIPVLNATFGVISNNDIRLYLLSPL